MLVQFALNPSPNPLPEGEGVKLYHYNLRDKLALCISLKASIRFRTRFARVI